MVQARRKTPAKTRAAKRSGNTVQGVALLVLGVVIGFLGATLWQGMQAQHNGVGAGIRKMVEPSQQAPIVPAPPAESLLQPTVQQTNYDFYTVLPEIEVVVPEPVIEDTAENTAEKASGQASEQGSEPAPGVEAEPVSPSARPVADNSVYMLQAGSYALQAEAESLKAKLALSGLVSSIQKISIQGRGDFYRVRLGPFKRYADMVAVDQQLSRQDVKALRLKLSGPG